MVSDAKIIFLGIVTNRSFFLAARSTMIFCLARKIYVAKKNILRQKKNALNQEKFSSDPRERLHQE